MLWNSSTPPPITGIADNPTLAAELSAIVATTPQRGEVAEFAANRTA